MFTFRFLGWCVRWSFATVFFLGVMALAGYFVFNEAVKGGGHVVVPDVVGLPVDRAQLVLAEAGLEIGAQQQVASDRFPEYHVMLQRPPADRVVRTGRKVQLTVSAGKQLESAPELVGQTLEAAVRQLESTRLLVGAIARMPHESSRDTVLGQDPPARSSVPTGGEVHLLVSDGPGAAPVFMPDIQRMPVRQAMDLLASLGVQAVPYTVENPGADYEVVLAQRPEPGTLLYPDQTVSFDVRPLPTTVLANAKRTVSYEYVVPEQFRDVELRIDVVDQNGVRNTIFPLPVHYRDGKPLRLSSGARISDTVAFTEEVTIEFYVNGVIERSYYYQGAASPVVTVYGGPANTQPLDAVEEQPLISVFEPASTRIGPPTRP